VKEEKKLYKSLVTECVECEFCKKQHLIDSKDYIAVYGNICEGMHGGLIGNNFDENKRLARISIFCKKTCFFQVINNMLDIKITGDKKA